MMATGEGTSQDSGSTTEDSSAVESSLETSQTGEYTTVDPGYDSVEPVEDELAALVAENKKTKPSDSAAAEDDDASDTEGGDTDGVVEEDAETQPGVQADAADDISDELLDRAIALGWELDDIRGVSDAKAFEKEIVRAERLQQRLQARKASEKDAGTEADEPTEPDWDRMIQDGHDPDIIALQKTNWQRATEAQARVRQLEQAERQRAAQAVSDRFDDALNGLGEEYSSLIGKGKRDELMKSSPELVKNRQKVFNTMAILRNGYVQSGEPVPPESELIQQALQASFYRQTQEIARKAVKAKIKNAGSQALSRPRSGSEKELPGPERALAKEEAFWRSHS